MKPQISFSHYLEYRLIRCLEVVMGLLPRSFSLKLGEVIGMCLYGLGIYREVVKKNMDYVGSIDEKNRNKITRSLYRNTGKIFADFIRPFDDSPPYTIDHFDVAKAIFAKGKGGIVVLAHFGNWEVLANVFGLKLYDLNVLAKPMKNRLVEKWLHAKRMKAHVTPIYVTNVLRKMLTILQRGGIVAMLIDQYAGSHGSSSLFLGKPANTIRSVAGMLRKTGCGIVFAYALLGKDGHYQIHIEEGPELGLSADDERFISAYQQAHNDVLSRWINAHPEHYFGWFHKRFKDTIHY
jgi:KDO2-lipid IV(A) lauroyltransferase